MIHTMATRSENPAPFMAVHPGMMIKPELEERGISQKDFAKMLGVQASHLSEVLNGKRALTKDLAVKIEGAIGLPAKMLLSAQTQYDLESVSAPLDDKEQETVSVTIPIRDRNLLREIVRKFGWACVF
jgi:HTH-type transcriptional regulator/antitoxin HigA